ncbi:hypothetical protein [Phaeovulum sp.]|uniref:hypothetical protein n=1 Tax=Phaeovulum sp. TaxID=2934796 RepID=UPI0035667A1F
MNEDFWLVLPVAVVWAVLALVYALAPWGDMIGYARVWGFGAALFLGLATLLWHRARAAHSPTND